MKAVRVIGAMAAGYLAIVVAFETSLALFQPTQERSMLITTSGEDGAGTQRVVSRVESDGKLYVAANHWPRAWYREALANPSVRVVIDGEESERIAVPVDDAEHERLQRASPARPVVRFLAGFPPRRFLRLDPAASPRPRS